MCLSGQAGAPLTAEWSRIRNDGFLNEALDFGSLEGAGLQLVFAQAMPAAWATPSSQSHWLPLALLAGCLTSSCQRPCWLPVSGPQCLQLAVPQHTGCWVTIYGACQE